MRLVSYPLERRENSRVEALALQEREGKSAPAFDAYQRATTIDPLNATALFYAGRASIKVGETRRGRELLERAAALAAEEG
jgi:hypothetical protein